MSGFWQQRINPTPAPSQPAQQQPTQPWWAPVTPSAQPAPQTPLQPQNPGQQGYPGQTPQTQGEASFTDLIHQDGYTTTKAKSLKDDAPCPDCGGPNFLSPQGHANAMKQCFDCGYNPRFTQTMAGMSATGQKNIPVHTARSQTLSENNFNPGQIIGHVS